MLPGGRACGGLGKAEVSDDFLLCRLGQSLVLLLHGGVPVNSCHGKRALYRDGGWNTGVPGLQFVHHDPLLYGEFPGATLAFEVHSGETEACHTGDDLGG